MNAVDRAWRAAAGGLVAWLVVGCTTTTTGSLQPLAAAPSGERKDIVTTSDETNVEKRVRLHMELALAYFGQRQYTSSLDEVKQALAADPNSGQAYNLRGLIYASLNDPALAEDSFRRALQIDPRDGDAMQNYGYFLCQQKRYPDADAQFEQALALPKYQSRARTLLTQGVCQAVAGRLPDAEQTLTQAYQADPANPATLVNLAEVLYRRGAYDRARDYIDRVNALPAIANAQTLWLAARVENRLGHTGAVQDLGRRLGTGYASSPEWAKFQRGAFDE
ncbi:MAG: type IV pilus biogenesis/stability protein PilW [Proteobacteria bacterium]|nr:type IV pilus biogenesis/stability protein PilW [Pseudomonadota bacterium]